MFTCIYETPNEKYRPLFYNFFSKFHCTQRLIFFFFWATTILSSSWASFIRKSYLRTSKSHASFSITSKKCVVFFSSKLHQDERSKKNYVWMMMYGHNDSMQLCALMQERNVNFWPWHFKQVLITIWAVPNKTGITFQFV